MYHYTLSGLDNIYLSNGYTFKETPYGETVAIQDIKGLHKAIGLSIIESPNTLTAQEIKFLRKEMKCSQKAFADHLGMTEVAVRKWESGDNQINGSSDRLLRAIYKEFVDNCVSVQALVDRLAQLDKQSSPRQLNFSETANGWQNEKAA